MWHPRGTPSWPDWKQAKEGTKVVHVRSGMTGTFVRAVTAHAVIDWDHPQFGIQRGRVVAPAFDLRPL